jgi:hypothetical protein
MVAERSVNERFASTVMFSVPVPEWVSPITWSHVALSVMYHVHPVCVVIFTWRVPPLAPGMLPISGV